MLRGLARPLARIQNALEYYPTNDELMVPMRGLYDEYTSFCISAIIVLKKWPCCKWEHTDGDDLQSK
jgi:hypothetical protein